MFLKTIILTSLLCLFTSASTIKVAMCANVSYVAKDLIKEFNKEYPDIKVQSIFGSSGKLAAQIKRGAPYDMFMSANVGYAKTLYQSKLSSKPIIYARGSLVCFSQKKRNWDNGIELILNKEIKKIAVGNPKTAPYGKITKEALKNSKLLDKVKHKFVYAESISQTLTYTMISCDVGFVAKSSLFAKNMKKYKKDENWIDVDLKLYTPINQAMAILKDSKNYDDTKKFYDFILSSKARKIFANYGYNTPDE